MPSRILRKRRLIEGQTTELVIEAPHIAAKAKPGNFVILRVWEEGERIPLTIADADTGAGTITLVFLLMGKTTAHLDTLEAGDDILDLCGPLGRPTEIHKLDGPVICVGGGTGIAAMHHIAKGHHAAGNHVVTIIGARCEDLLLFRDELCSFCPEVLISTNDGSCGRQGFVTDLLVERLTEDKTVAEVVAIGPVPMMRAVAEATRPFGVKTTVSLNSIMVDGIGMCGACRVSVGGETKFACVDGPEFDGHQVDFAGLAARLTSFKEQERLSYEEFKKSHVCQCSK
ncbi:oxidoreductase FAD/NAD(P)-binding domain protein [Solidesulfovibrio carbinoliphilus subsp. oakridgensis]|uniref:Oxidoreductase FAD/NAD(P)-binding domain protein n=1 Tax=Solidesulfovibrio carbinoliphilus subsp. oakridgensis TaxID=694327 RepID=G7QBZ1_9BACT|nr:sulfide/dihydroorotate dehydrogenase-like FAD/NAD-binding protein [Solidesulfovibrio carbinoliphilus]EHJ46026.1 oxidoreductase FAD/NAD(P)-binding domain protein [Solidesulfovibrio carbinoliphilus subsp. oakridgensis]